MEISNNINSVNLDIDKLTFKKDDGANSFLIDIQPTIESVTNANVLSSSVPFQSSDLYLTGLPSTNKSILTKISTIDTSFDKIDASLIDLYNNGGGGGGGGTFSGAATSLQFGSSSVNLPSVIGTNGQTLLYNSSTGTFAWGEGGGSGGSNILTFGTTDKTLPTALGAHDQVIVYNGITQQLEWGDRTTGSGGGGVSTTDFSLFIGKVDNSFSKVYEDIDRIDASINTRIDISLEEIKNSISNATNDNYYSTTILDSSFTDLSSVIHDVSDNVQDISATLESFRVVANSNFTTIINELATTNDKFDDNNARFLTVNTNFNAFDDIITDICNNNLKPLMDNSNALLIGNTYLQLPSAQPQNGEILRYENGGLTWSNDSGGGGGGGSVSNINVNILTATQSSTNPEQWTLTLTESIHTDNIGSTIRQDQGGLGDIVGDIQTVGTYSSGESGSANEITVNGIVRGGGAASDLPFKVSSHSDVVQTYYTVIGGSSGGGGGESGGNVSNINVNILTASQSSTNPEQWTLTLTESIHTDNIGETIRQDQGGLGDIVGDIQTVGTYSSGESGSANEITVNSIVRGGGAASDLPFKVSSHIDVVQTYYTIVSSGGSTSQEVTNHIIATDASFVIVDNSFDIVDNSFDIVDTSFNSIDASFIIVDNSFDSVHNSLVAFENILITHDNSFGSYIEPSLNQLKSDILNQNTNHTSLSNTVTDNTTRIGVSETHIQTLFTNVSTFYSKTLLDASFTDISGKITDLSNTRNDNDTLINNKIYKIDLSINRIDTSLVNIENNISSIENNIVNIDTSINDNLTSINSVESNVLALQQANSGLSTQISNLNNKKTDYLDTADGHRLPMPATRPPGKALVVSSDSTVLEWGNVSEITRDSDVNLLNLNVYGSTDVSGNIRVSDELIVGMTDAKESIRTKGIIKTNELTVHSIVFPNNLDHAQRTVDISQQDIYHDISGIHITKSYLHDVDISGTVNILPTNSILTPLGVTIKFL